MTYLQHCQYCGAEVVFTEKATLIKCVYCGNTLVVSQLCNEIGQMRKLTEKSECVEKALQEAMAEKERLQEQLGYALTELSGIRGSQEVQDARLEKILYVMGEERNGVQALIDGIRGNQDENRDALARLTRSVLQGKSDVDGKLEALQKTVQQLLKTQGDAAAVNHTVLRQMKATEQQKMQMMGEIKAWVENGWQANAKRLEAIGAAVGELQAHQKVRVDLVQQLQVGMEYTRNQLDSFYDDWKQKNLAEMAELLQQAEDKQADREFDKAIERYELFLTKGESYRNDPEIRWRIVMCHYGVEYKKNKQGKYVPTILRPDLTPPENMSVRTNLLNCCSDGKVRACYERQLQEIDALLNRYRALRNERQYDIFLSVKQTDSRGWRTRDSDRASTLFDQLTGWGYRVFNSERSEKLQPIPAGEEWEPYVISALMSARVMIVVGTNARNMNAEWVRDEWTRFQWLQKDEARRGRKERVLFCYLALSMTPEKIPRGLNPDIQAIVEGVNAESKLKSTLEGIFGNQGTGSSVAPADPPKTSENEVLSQMRAWLANGQYAQVQEKYALLMADGKHLGGGWVHLYKLCADFGATDPYRLAEMDLVLEEHPIFELAEDTPGDHQKILNKLVNTNRAANKQREREKKKQRRIKERESDIKKQETKKDMTVAGQIIGTLIWVAMLIGAVYFADARGWIDVPWERVRQFGTWAEENNAGIKDAFVEGLQIIVDSLDGEENGSNTDGGAVKQKTASPQQAGIGTVAGLQLTESGMGAILQWNRYAGATRYSICYRRSASDEWLTIVETNNSSIMTYYFYSGFNYYYIKAYDARGNMLAISDVKTYYKEEATPTPTVKAKTTPRPTEQKTVQEVKNLNCEQHGTGVSLKWNAMSGATQYKVYIGTRVDGPWSLMSTTEKIAIKTHYCYNDMRNYFYVEAYDSTGHLIGRSKIENCYILVE